MIFENVAGMAYLILLNLKYDTSIENKPKDDINRPTKSMLSIAVWFEITPTASRNLALNATSKMMYNMV